MTTALSTQQNNLRSLFERQKMEMARAIPKHLTADVLIRVALTTIFRTPKLMDCDPRSLIAAVMDASQLGLKCDSSLGQAYLVPYGKQATLIVGWRGLIELARRSGRVSEFYSYAVYENDEYNIELGLNRDLKHTPAKGDRGALIATYAVMRMVDGGFDFEFMYKDEIDAVKKKAKARRDGPWVTHYDEMARKTPIRRLAKRAPVSSDMQTAVAYDERQDGGMVTLFKDTSEVAPGAADKVIDVEASETTPDPGIEETKAHKEHMRNVTDQVAADAPDNYWDNMEHWQYRKLPEFYLMVMVGMGVLYTDHEILVDNNLYRIGGEEAKEFYMEYSVKRRKEAMETLMKASPETINRIRRKFEVNLKIDSKEWDRLVAEGV